LKREGKYKKLPLKLMKVFLLSSSPYQGEVRRGWG
jgi:hypothetical protein